MLEVFNQPWLGTVVTIVGLAVGLAGVLYARLTRPHASLACVMRTVRIVGVAESELPTDAEIRFAGRRIARLSRTSVFMWNEGNQTIAGSQIVERDPLRLAFRREEAILQARIGAVSRPVVGVSCATDINTPAEVFLRFDFLDAGDGARVDILHTSTLSYPAVLGTIRGLPRGIRLVTARPVPFLDAQSSFRRRLASGQPRLEVFVAVLFSQAVVAALSGSAYLRLDLGIVLSGVNFSILIAYFLMTRGVPGRTAWSRPYPSCLDAPGEPDFPF